MFDHRHYVPILKWKMGEAKALEDSSDLTKNRLTPLIEIVPIPWDYEDDQPAKTLDDHLNRVPSQIARSWDMERPIFLDGALGHGDGLMANGWHPLVYLAAHLNAEGVTVIPVTSPNRDPAYQQAVASVQRIHRSGMCIRLGSADFTGNLHATLPTLLQQFDLNESQADVVIDLAAIDPAQQDIYEFTARAALAGLPNIQAWRSITLAGTSFPVNLSGIMGTTQIPRSEWLIWQSIISDPRGLPRLPAFGDYAIAHPEMADVDPRLMTVSANIRYTLDTSWVIFKGRAIKSAGAAQYHTLCQSLVASQFYYGPAFSWGDQYIADCAAQAVGPGNATTWRKVATNHHLAVAASSLP